MNDPKKEVGRYLYWYDPDGDACSDYGTVQSVNGEIIFLTLDNGSEVACFSHELEL